MLAVVALLGFRVGSSGEDGAVAAEGTEGGTSDNGDFRIESLHRHDLGGDFIFGDALGRATDREPGYMKGAGETFGTPLEIDDDFPPDESDDPDWENAGRWKAFRLGEDVADDPFPRPECHKFESLSVEIFVCWMRWSGTRTREDVVRGG